MGVLGGLPEGVFDSLVAVYTTFRDVGEDVLGRLGGLVEEAYRAALGARGAVVLSTCNRFEVYLDDPDGVAWRRVAEFIESNGGVVRVARGAEAARRVLRIAAGLESAILGEPEILGQVRDAWRAAREAGRTTPLLDSVFHAALVAGKRVREETGISRGNASYPSAAVSLAARSLGGLDGLRVLVAGGGEAGLGMLRVLCASYRPSLVVVATGRPGEVEGEVRALCPDAVVAGRLEARRYAPFDAALVAVRDGRGLEWVPAHARVVVDISTPQAVHGPNVHGMREVEEAVRRVIEERRRWVPRAEEIVEDELSKLARRLAQRRVSRLIRYIVEYAEALAGRGDCGDPSRFARRLLHPLLAGLREAAASSWRLEDFIQSLEEEYRRRLAEVAGGDGDGSTALPGV